MELLLLISRAANRGDVMTRPNGCASHCNVHMRGFSFTLQFRMEVERLQQQVTYVVRLLLCVVVVVIGSGVAASANIMPYLDRPVSAESENLLVEFRSACKEGEVDYFRCSFELVMTDKGAGKDIVSIGRIRVTHLWIAPDERYIVALSNVSSQQGPHVLVLRRDGSIAAARVITCGLSFLPKCDDGISDRIFWFGGEFPEPKVIEHQGRPVALELWTRSFTDLLGDLAAQTRPELPDRFVVPLSCRTGAGEVADTPSCQSVGSKTYGSRSADTHSAALRAERIILALWNTYRLLDRGELKAGLKELDTCPDIEPAPCSCGHARHNLLARLGRSAAAAQLRVDVLVKCREYIGSYLFAPHRESGAR